MTIGLRQAAGDSESSGEGASEAAQRERASPLLIVIPLVIFAVALTSRLYDLSGFPYFATSGPWFGVSPPSYPSLTGLYTDEYGLFQAAQSFFGGTSLLVFGPISKVAVRLSTMLFGYTATAVRLPFGIVSSLSAVLVYLTTFRLTRSRLSGVASACFFIVMMPALVYGRMAFGENFIALFFLLTFYLLLELRASMEPRRTKRLLLLASLTALLAALSKLNGFVVIVFLVLFLSKYSLLRRGAPYLIALVSLAVLAPIAILGIAYSGLPLSKVQPILSNLATVALPGNELSVWRYFLFATMPSGVATVWGGGGGFPVPEFWYIFLYLALAVVAYHEFSGYSDLFLALATFAALALVLTPLGSYSLTVIQPLLSIAFGPSLKYLIRMPVSVGLAVYAFLFVPISTSIGIVLITPLQLGVPQISDASLVLWKALFVLPPILLLLFSSRPERQSLAMRRWANGALLLSLFAALIVASYFVPDLYPYYI